MKWINEVLAALAGYFKFSSISDKGVVVYFEGTQDVPHLLPIVNCLKQRNQQVTVVASEEMSEIDHIFIGSGFFRILFFQLLDCEIILMTMPDLERLHIKRSKNPVKYAYVFHSLSSSHTIYHEEAFDAYDIIFAAGKHHVTEIEKREKLKNIKSKNIIEGGYPRIDSIISSMPDTLPTSDTITIAPTWGSGSLLEHEKNMDILKAFIDTGYHICLRIHPMTKRHHPQLIENLKKSFGSKKRFSIVENMSDKSSLYESFMMVSDWSGAAFDFSFTQKRPVLFINTPQKINNPNFQEMELPAAEDEVRNHLGRVVELEDLSNVKSIVDEFRHNKEEWKKRIEQLDNEFVFNLGCSAEKIASEIMRLK